MKTYNAYRFRGKDPSVDEVKELIEGQFGTTITRKILQSVSESGGPPSSTTGAWFFGKTRRPRNDTLEAAGRAVGFKRKWVKMNGKGRE